jgi:hypothetical protein
MAGKKDKARRYLRWAALNERRAAEAYNGDLKTLFLQIAAQYRDLAEQIADPEQWQANATVARSSTPCHLCRVLAAQRSSANPSS